MMFNPTRAPLPLLLATIPSSGRLEALARDAFAARLAQLDVPLGPS